MSNNNRKSQVVIQVLLAVVLVAAVAVPGPAEWEYFQEQCQEYVQAEIEGLTPAQPIGGQTATIEFRITYSGQGELRDYDGNPGSRVVVQWSTDTGYIGMPHYLPDTLYLQAGETSEVLSDTVTLPQTLNYVEVEIGLEDNTMQAYAVVGGGVVQYTIGRPRFEDCGATPYDGDEATEFCFRAQYISGGNNAPTAVKVEIDGQLHEMQKEDASDTNYTDGCWYAYTTGLPIGNHTFKCIAYNNDEVLAQTPLKYYPQVNDAMPPVIVGADQERPPITICLENEVTVTGTATDNIGVTQVQWSSDAQHWHTAQGTTQWSFTANFDVPDQGVRSEWIYVRAKDGAGNYTPGAQFWKQQVFFDNHHPHVVEHFVTEASLVGLDLHDSGIHESRPMNRGTPTMGNPYLAACRRTSCQSQHML